MNPTAGPHLSSAEDPGHSTPGEVSQGQSRGAESPAGTGDFTPFDVPNLPHTHEYP